MLKRAGQAAREHALENVRVEVGDAEAPPAVPGWIDAIIASLVLFFLPDIANALDAYAKTLVPGGTLAFSTFGDDDDWASLDQLLESFMPPSPPAQRGAWFDSRDGIRSILEAHDFQDITVDEVTHQVEFPTISAFHEWSWSTGWRATWSAIPVEHHDVTRAAVDSHLLSLQERRGPLRLETAVRYTRATAA